MSDDLLKTDDLVKRLRQKDESDCYYSPLPFNRDGLEAADAIEALQARVAEARAKALEDAAKLTDDASERSDWPTSRWLEDLADAIRDLKATATNAALHPPKQGS